MKLHKFELVDERDFMPTVRGIDSVNENVVAVSVDLQKRDKLGRDFETRREGLLRYDVTNKRYELFRPTYNMNAHRFIVIKDQVYICEDGTLYDLNGKAVVIPPLGYKLQAARINDVTVLLLADKNLEPAVQINQQLGTFHELDMDELPHKVKSKRVFKAVDSALGEIKDIDGQLYQHTGMRMSSWNSDADVAHIIRLEEDGIVIERELQKNIAVSGIERTLNETVRHAWNKDFEVRIGETLNNSKAKEAFLITYKNGLATPELIRGSNSMNSDNEPRMIGNTLEHIMLKSGKLYSIGEMHSKTQGFLGLGARPVRPVTLLGDLSKEGLPKGQKFVLGKYLVTQEIANGSRIDNGPIVINDLSQAYPGVYKDIIPANSKKVTTSIELF